MAACGITSIPIGGSMVSSGLLQEALKSTKGVSNVNAAVAKSYSIVKKSGVSLDEWEAWYINFNDPKPGKLGKEDIFNDPKKDFSKRFQNLINLVEMDNDKYIVGNYAKRVFNRVRANLLARGQGMTRAEMEIMQISLRSVLTRDRLLQDARKLRQSAKKNIKTKIGAQKFLKPMMEKVLSLDPNFIPADRLDVYFRLLEEFGQHKKVLQLRDVGAITQDIQEIIQGLPESLFEKQKKAEKTTEDVPTEVMVDIVKRKSVDSSKLSNEFEKEYADRIEGYTREQLSMLDNKQLQTLMDAIDNVNNGFFPPALLEVINDIEANIGVENTTEHVAKASGVNATNIVTRTIGGIKGLLKGTTTDTEVVRGNPLTAIDEFFGNKGTEVYNNTFGKLASAYSKYETEVKGITESLNKIEKALRKKFKGNKLAKAKFQIKYYQMQREFEANPNEDVYAADEWIAATIEDEKNTGFYSDESIALLKEIQKEFAGKTSEQIHAKLHKSQQDAIATMDKINDNIVPKSLFTAGVIRGEKVTMFNHYTHHNVIGDNTGKLSGARRDAFTSPGVTKAGTVNERTEGVKPISFDPFYDFSVASRGLLLDFHMTPTNREVLRTTNRLVNEFKNGTKEQKAAVKALNEAVKEVLGNVFDSNNKEYSTLDEVVEKVKKLSYQATLASAPRFVAELASNAGFALFAAPGSFSAGATKYSKYAKSETSVKILNNVGSSQTGKLYESGITGSKHVESTINPAKREKAQAQDKFREGVGRAVENIGKYTGVSYAAGKIDQAADALISTPDRMISRPLWFGEFAKRFKAEAGVDVDFDAIEANDTAYMKANKKAIEAARTAADQLSVMAGATNNPFSGIIKLQMKKGGGAANVYRMLSGYLQRFLLFEYQTAKTAVMSMIGSGKLTRQQGAGVLAGVMTRMTMYGVIMAVLSELIAEAFGAGDEEDPMTIDKAAGIIKNDFMGSALTMLTGRNLTSFPKIPINAAIEHFNEESIGEDYNPYEDSLVWSQIGSQDFRYGSSLGDWLLKLAGPYGTPLKGANYVWKDYARAINTKDPVKKQERLEKVMQKLMIQTGGHSGLIPFFKDVNKLLKQIEYQENKRNKGKKDGFSNGFSVDSFKSAGFDGDDGFSDDF